MKKIMAIIIVTLFLASITTSAIIPVKAESTKLTFLVTSADIIAGVDALNQWLVDNGMDTFGGTHMPAEARIPGQTIMSLVHSTPQRWLGDFWLYPYDPYDYFGGEGGNPPLGFDTWTSVVSQDTNVADWVNDNTYWVVYDWKVPWWHATDYDTYPAQAFLDELIEQPGFSTDEFYFTIVIDTSQADANGKYRFFFSGESYRNPPIGGSDVSVFLGFVDLAPLTHIILEDLKDEINALPDDHFKPPAADREAALIDKINDVIAKIDAGDCKGAIMKLLGDIRPKLDSGAKQSWLVEPHLELLAKVGTVVGILEGLL